jgi:hypothetical protein
MASLDGGLPDRDIPTRGASFAQIAAFADTVPSYAPRSHSYAYASLNSNGNWEGTLSQLCHRLYIEVRRIHYVTNNDPASEDMELLYALLDAIRSRVIAALSGS